MLEYMTEERVVLSVDRQKRISVGKLGFGEGHLVADRLSDGSGWVLRPAVVLNEAEIDILRKPENVEDILKGLAVVEAGQVTPWVRREK